MGNAIVEINDDGLRTDKQAAFVREYCKDFNATQSAIRAGYSERTAQEIASEMLSKPIIRAAIDRRIAAAADVAMVDSALVISELATLALADPRELMSVKITCCRFCHGVEHQYQWNRKEYERELNKALSSDEPKDAPDASGGFGWDPRLQPHPDCTHCLGDGLARVVVKPSAKLSRGAARLLASFKQTKDGIEVKTHDQQAALMALGKITGAIKDRQEISGPNGTPLQLQPVPAAPLHTMSNEELEELLRQNGRTLNG